MANEINGTRNFSDWEYQKFREDSTGKPAIAVVDANGSPIGSALVYDIKNISPPNDPEIATYKYYGFVRRGGTAWRIMRKTLATNVFLYATGTSAYSTAWTNKDSQSYS